MRYRISELAALAGVTPRTIRYYTSERLLPCPMKQGRTALYDDAHLFRLALIAELKEAYLPLSVIRERIGEAENEDREDAPGLPTGPTTGIKPDRASRRRSSGSVSSDSGFAPVARLAGVTPSRERFPSDAHQRIGFAQIVARDNPPETPSVASYKASARSTVIRQSWRRVTLAPGVELSYADGLGEPERHLVERLLSFWEGISRETREND